MTEATMTTPPAHRRPFERRVQARVIGVFNVPMRWLLKLPFATPMSKRLMLVKLTGRRSGRIYNVPLSYVRDGDALLTPGGGNWKLNLVEGRPELIRLAGKDVFARPELIRDPVWVTELLETIGASNPTALKFVGVKRRADGRLDQAQIDKAIRYGFCIVRWHIIPS